MKHEPSLKSHFNE